jgi:hypothetical protein
MLGWISGVSGEVRAVAFLLFVIVMGLLLAFDHAVTVYYRRGEGQASPQEQPSAVTPAVEGEGEREEAALSAELFAGDLPTERYQRRMADLAAQDELRHPMQ